MKVYCNTAVGRAFLATFLATFLERLLTTLLTTLNPEGRKSNPRKKKYTFVGRAALSKGALKRIRDQLKSIERFSD